MIDRTYYPGLELNRLEDWARCTWPHCKIVTGLGVGNLAEPHCNEHAQWVHAAAVEDALFAARGCVHELNRVCDRCAGAKLAGLDRIEADCGCVYSVPDQQTEKWCDEHDPAMGGIGEAVSSS